MRYSVRICMFLITCAVLINRYGYAEETTPPDPKERITAAMAAINNLNSIAFNLTMTSRVKVGDDKESKEDVIQGDVLLNSKSDLFYHLKSNNEEVQIISNGEMHYLYMPLEKKYSKLTQKIERDKIMAVVNGGIFESASTWLADFVNNNQDLIAGAGAITLEGEETLLNIPCDMYKLEYASFDTLAFVSKASPPALVRFEIDMAKSLTGNAHGGKKITASVITDITNWQVNIPAPAEKFTFTPPEGVEEEVSKTPPESGPAVGEEAPVFTAPLVKGGEMSLAAHKDKEVVLLDFWATWCGPCRMALPVVNKLAEEFAGKGVVIYAVNQGETPDVIQPFLNDQKLTLPVALDGKGEVGMKYGGGPIPRLYVIGKDGRIKALHRGYNPALENELRSEIAKALGINAPETAAPEAASNTPPTAAPAAGN